MSARPSYRPCLGVLAEMTLDDVRAFRAEVVILTLTSTEPHGPHLPYGTDFFIGDGIVREAVQQANKREARVLMYPSLPVGNNVNFRHFPFACRVRVRTYMNMLLDILEALEEDGIRKIVLLNSHGGNTETARAVLREHFERHRPDGTGRAFVSFCTYLDLIDPAAAGVITHPSDHAGESETSLIQHFQPGLVRPEHLADFPVNQPDLEELRDGRVFFVRPWEKYLPVSAGGETRESGPEKGRIQAGAAVRGLADYLVRLSQAPWHPGFPYPSQAEPGFQ